MIKHICIGSINRHGGSLLARLFDGHPDVGSYPTEWGFPEDDVVPFSDMLNGNPTSIPEMKNYKNDILQFLNITEKKIDTEHKWGKERSDPVGVRKNYLEKAFYQNIKTDFDYDKYIQTIKKFNNKVNSVHEIYDAKHNSYFDAWDKGKHKGSLKYVVVHSSGGLYLKSFDKYFSEFNDSYVLCPIIDIKTYIASEKTRLARLYFGSRRFQKPRVPNFLVKAFNVYDLQAQIRTWLVALSRIVIMQQKYGVNGKFIVYRYENLVSNTQDTMKSISNKINLNFNSCLLKPTIASVPWLGNSHSGKQEGINLSTYYKDVLRNDEINEIDSQSYKIVEELNKIKTTPIDLLKIPESLLYDFKLQKELSNDDKMWAIYSAYAFRGYRSVRVKKVSWIAIIAYIFSKIIYLANIPRLIKLRLFPGIGKQNYT